MPKRTPNRNPCDLVKTKGGGAGNLERVSWQKQS